MQNEEAIHSTGGERGYDPSSHTHAQFATFLVGDLLFGVDVMQVQEIIRYQEMTPVPQSSPMIEGLINLRGQIITAICMRRRLGLPERDANHLPMNVVVRHEDEVISLLVDEIGDVLEVSSSQFEQTPDTIEERSRDLVEGVYKLDGKLLLVLDCARAIDVEVSE
ncbi:MAG: chemotaxis protein CheW [Bdellovibrionales bacterium]|nr:chemotaxis protein CheW [Bdellovibrionales bacterium]